MIYADLSPTGERWKMYQRSDTLENILRPQYQMYDTLNSGRLYANNDRLNRAEARYLSKLPCRITTEALMRPDQRWFPTNMVERAAWYANFTPVYVEVAPSLGFSQAEIDQIVADNAIVQYLAKAISSLANYERAVRSFQRTLLLGRRGAETPLFPSLPSMPVPPIPPTGVFERLERNVRRVRVQTGYSASLGARMGIIPRKPPRADLATYVPKLKAKGVAAPYTFEVRVPMREFNMCMIEYKRQGSPKWELAFHSTIGKASVTVDPTTPGQPEMIDVRVRMCEGNTPAGHYSNIQTIVLTP